MCETPPDFDVLPHVGTINNPISRLDNFVTFEPMALRISVRISENDAGKI